MANQNKLTSDGLTVGRGTITNFIPAFGSNVVGTGEATVTVPSSSKSMPKSPTLGTAYAFNAKASQDADVRLPSSGRYCYAYKNSARQEYVSGTISISPFNSFGIVSGGVTIFSGNEYVGGGIVRVE